MYQVHQPAMKCFQTAPTALRAAPTAMRRADVPELKSLRTQSREFSVLKGSRHCLLH